MIKATLYVYLCIVMYFILEAINYYYWGSTGMIWGATETILDRLVEIGLTKVRT